MQSVRLCFEISGCDCVQYCTLYKQHTVNLQKYFASSCTQNSFKEWHLWLSSSSSYEP
jgi:hypothetical protein